MILETVLLAAMLQIPSPILPPPEPPPIKVVRRIESLDWNPVTGRLSWTASRGRMTGDVYTQESSSYYEIDMGAATMEFNGEVRGFGSEEAGHVVEVLNKLSRYCRDSVLWWEAGEGEVIRKPKTTRDPK